MLLMQKAFSKIAGTKQNNESSSTEKEKGTQRQR